MTWLGLILAFLPAYLVRFTILGLPTTLLEVLIVVFLFIVLVRTGPADLARLRQLGRINWAIGLFVMAGIIATIVSPETLRALGQLKAFIVEPVLLFYAAVLQIKTESDLKITLRWLFAGAVAVSLLGIVQYFTLLHLPPRFWGSGLEPERIISVYEHPNELALYLAPLLIFFTTLFVNKVAIIKNRIWFVIALLILSVALLLTFSRGAWLGVAAGGLVLLLRRHSWKALGLGLACGAILLLFTPVRARLETAFSDPSSAVHLDLMRIGVREIIKSPWVGNGLYGFRTTLQEMNYQGDLINFPHNIFLNFWVETGLLGLGSFLAIIFLCFTAYKKRPGAYQLAAGMFLVTMIVHGLVDTPYFKNDLSVMFWFTISLFYLRNFQ